MGITLKNNVSVLAVDHKGQQIYIDYRLRDDDLDIVSRDCKGTIVQHLYAIGNAENEFIEVFSQSMCTKPCQKAGIAREKTEGRITPFLRMFNWSKRSATT